MDFIIGVIFGAVTISLVVMFSLAKSAGETDVRETQILDNTSESAQNARRGTKR